MPVLLNFFVSDYKGDNREICRFACELNKKWHSII